MPTQHTIEPFAPRYGFDPKVAFAATRAGAERRRRGEAAALPGPAATRSRWRRIRMRAARRSG
jgi:hypothetical protein